jgi:hypothetical protein
MTRLLIWLNNIFTVYLNYGHILWMRIKFFLTRDTGE